MTKKQLYIIIGIFAIITLGFLFAAFVISQGEKTGTESKNPISNFFPFGKSSDTENTPGGDGANNTDTTGASGGSTDFTKKNIPKKNLQLLRMVSKGPISGMYATGKTGKTYIDYIERETGNVFETKLEDMLSNRLSNSLMPKISEAFFANKGKSVVVRYLKSRGDTISTFILDISKAVPEEEGSASSTENSLPNGKFLTQGISDIKISSDEKTAFYLTRSGNFNDRNSFGSVYDFEKNTTSEVFQSPFTEWLPVSVSADDVILQSKASQKVPGYLYSFNFKTGVLQKIIGGPSGLTALPSPDRSNILYSASTKGGIGLFVYNTKTGTSIKVSVSTLPEKCVWKNDGLSLYCAIPKSIPSSEYPDVWYQGVVSFTDDLWQIDARTGKSSTVFVPSSFTSQAMDMTTLTLSQTGDFLFYINKKDSSLWAFDLAGSGLE